jgi:hypothetical protein
LLLRDIIINCNFWITIKWNGFGQDDHSVLECHCVVSYKLADISEVLTASIIRTMSKPREKDVCENGMLQWEHESAISVKFNVKIQILAANG